MSDTTQYDVVIIGSGLGGLICGNLLGMYGKKVCIIEKHDQIGGNLQTFTRGGCLFDTGMHYIGSFKPGQPMYQIFKYLDLVGKFDVEELNPDGFDEYCLAGHEFKVPSGYENFRKALKDRFPEETVAIDTFIDKIIEITTNINQLILPQPSSSQELVIPDAQNAYDFINSLSENKVLRAILAGNNGLYCGSSLKTPLYLMANINNFYINSAFRMTGGGHQLANALRSNIEHFGGEIVINTQITKLNFDNERVVSAESQDGRLFYGKEFISNIHPALTVDLVEPGKLRKSYVERIKSIESTTGAFAVYVVFEKNRFKHRNSNFYYSNTLDVWDIHRDPSRAWPWGYMLYTTQDGDSEYAESAQIITMMNWDDVKQWENTTVGKRGKEYREFKEVKANLLIDMVNDYFPDFKESVTFKNVATPLTFRDYTGSKNGAIYGLEKDCNNLFKSYIAPRTKIPNLHLTGQNINNHGLMGVSIGALLTCSAFLDLEEVLSQMRKS